jgi:Rieske Fe-S protein
MFLARAWKGGAALLAVAGAWTSWDLIQPGQAAGFGGKVKAFSADAVPSDTVVEVRQARAYLTKVNDEIVALSEVCPHLGCRVPFCSSSGWFECPCHGSKFDRAGDYEEGPAPRGMDRYAVEIVDGMVVVDTSKKLMGSDPGTRVIDEPAKGPHCTGEEA